MAKSKLKYYDKASSTLNFGSFPGKILFSIGYSFKQISKQLKKEKCKDWLKAFENTKETYDMDCAGYAATRVIKIKGIDIYYNFIIIKKAFDVSDTNIHTTIAHEVIHSCSSHLSDHLDIVRENEAFAYTHSHLMKQIYDLLTIPEKN